ncbi:putative flavoprotein [Hypoxylon argillaceum]|nr:putative flavoprotein [Hypoxylon argillaceum]
MLQAISNGHDSHHIQMRKNSLETLTTSLDDGKIHLLLGCSGSVATIKLPNIIQALSKYPSSQLSIRVVLTPSASRFLAGQSREQPTISALISLPNVDAVYVDADEWKVPWVRGGGILHIELRRWADICVIAPLSANTMAKIVGGFADSLLTSVVRAWDTWGELDAAQEGTGGVGTNRRLKKRRIIVAPAMNTAMWRHPITAKQLRVLEEEWGVGPSAPKTQPDDGAAPDPLSTSQEPDQPVATEDEGDGWFEVLRPQRKVLACGDAGDGAMVEWPQIVAVIEERLGLGV